MLSQVDAASGAFGATSPRAGPTRQRCQSRELVLLPAAVVGGEHDFGRLEIAMYEGIAMHRVERVEDRGRDGNGPGGGQRPALVKQGIEGASINEGLHEVEQPIGFFAEVDERHSLGVERGG